MILLYFGWVTFHQKSGSKFNQKEQYFQYMIAKVLGVNQATVQRIIKRNRH